MTDRPVRFLTQGGNRSFPAALDVALAAEAAGFSGVGFADRPHDPMLDGWTLSTAVAARTERIRIFHATLNVPYRLPALIAREAATLDLISNGRLDLCLGAAGEQNRALYASVGVTLASPGERLTDLADAIRIIRGIWANDRFTYHGRRFEVHEAVGLPKPIQQPIPIWMGGLLPRSLQLAGRLADGFMKNSGWAPVAEVAAINRQVDVAAREAGRDPAAISRIINGGAFVGTAREVEAYWQRNSGPRKGPAQAEGLVGTREELLALIRRYREVGGIDTFNARFQPEDALEQIQRFGQDVIPAVAP